MAPADDPDRHPRPWYRRRSTLAMGGVLVAVGVWAVLPTDPAPARMAAVAVLMAWWWVTEAVPIPVTSLLPLVLLPVLGIVDLSGTAASYGKPVIFLFLGGFLLALGIQRSGLHRRIALTIVPAVGSQPRRLLLGFMLANAGLSMWISNTASVLVALPIALSVLDAAKERGSDPRSLAIFGTALMLGIAYAADIGGMATPVGTPPNLVLTELQESLLPGTDPFSFAQWMLMGIPLSVVFLAGGWWLLAFRLFPLGTITVFQHPEVLVQARRELGPVTRDEIASGGIFLCAAVLWMTGSDLNLGDTTVPGWRSLTGLYGVGDASVAIALGIALFIVPSGSRERSALMDWNVAEKQIPWGLLLLFGGGFAVALGFQESGLSSDIGRGLQRLAGLPQLGIVALVSTALTFLTELTSNTATTTLVLPILAETGGSLGMDPRALMIPATLSASCAFMMPVASPTQAIIFGTGRVSIQQMVRAGIWFNVLGVLLVTAVFAAVAGPVFGILLE